MTDRLSSALIRNSRTTALVLSVFILLFAVTAQAQTRIERKQILLLNSYHHNFIWNEEIMRGLTDVLRPKETGIDLHVENMDTKRVAFNEFYVQQLRNVYAHKFKGMKLDLIMVTDNNAFEFMRRYHDELFPGVPLVFCGINNYSNDLIKGHPLFTGVAENVDAKGTLWAALKLHPNTKRVYFLNDYTPTGKALVESIKTQLADFPLEVEVRYANELDMPELNQEIENLLPDELVIFGIYYRDKHGRFYDRGEVLRSLTALTDRPIYGLIDFDLGEGIVGGMLTSGYNQGQSMAQMALHVLAGRHPSDIPAITEGSSLPMFDYDQIKRHGIDLKGLPEGSKLINRPQSFYTENTRFIWFGVAFTVIQMVIILVLMANTSRRKQAEKELRRAHQLLEERVRERTSEVKESVEALQTVFDSSHDAIFIHDVAGHILDVNERMLKMYGITRNEIGEVSIARDISSRDNAVYRLSSLWRSVVNGEPQYFEWKARRPHDGSEFDVEVYLNRIVYRGQEAILANVRDISVRKESENSIRQSLSKFEAILENSLMGIAMTVGTRIVTINQRGAEIFGYTPDELIGSEFTDHSSGNASVTDFLKTSRVILSEKGVFNTDIPFRNKAGKDIWCRMYVKAIDPDSLDKGVIWAWDDITTERQAQKEVELAREAAEAANRAKSEFLAAMSHEIRTPMNAIVGMTDITLQTELQTEQRDYLRTVKDSAQHLLSIINDILDLSKIEARKLTLDRADFDLRLNLSTTIKGLEMQAQQKGLDLTLNIDDDAPEHIKGDPIALRQILMNLVGNAIKFTHRGGIDVRVKRIHKKANGSKIDHRSVGLAIEVEDTGIGIPDEFMETIFNSFAQTTRAFGGTGLGLAICKQLIKLMGGSISVASKVGKGSVFAFTAWFEPGAASPEPTEQQNVLSVTPTGPVRILVAEDNEVNVMVTTLRLEELGYSYAVAGNGLEVLDLLKREPFDLILMDIEMPVLDGISATKAIRSAVPGGPIPTPDIPIVGVTAHALKEFRNKSLDAGMDDYVSKPVDFHELTRIINRLLGGEQPTSETPPVNNARQGDTETPDQQHLVRTIVGEELEDELPPWTPDKAREDLGVDDAMFNDFLATAESELTVIIKEIEQAVGSGDHETTKELAGTVKSICSSVGAHLAALAAADLENFSNDPKASKEKLKDLSWELNRLLSLMGKA